MPSTQRIRDLSDRDEYRKVMSFPLTFEVSARTENFEEYSMEIVAKSQEQADDVARILCGSLGLILQCCTEKE